MERQTVTKFVNNLFFLSLRRDDDETKPTAFNANSDYITMKCNEKRDKNVV